MWFKTGLLLAISKRICLGLTLSAHSFSKTHPTSARREIRWVISKKTKYFVSTSLHRSLRLYNEQINDLMTNPSTLWVSWGTSFLITARMGRKDVLQSIELEGQGYPLLILLHHLELGLRRKYILSQPESWFGLESLIFSRVLKQTQDYVHWSVATVSMKVLPLAVCCWAALLQWHTSEHFLSALTHFCRSCCAPWKRARARFVSQSLVGKVAVSW